MQHCPTDQSFETNLGESTVVVNWTNPEAIDNSGQNLTVTCSLESGSHFEIGETDVICQVNDLAENSTTCNFTVQIEGNWQEYHHNHYK